MSTFARKIQSLVEEPRRCKLMYDKCVDQIMTFKYLTANITSNKNLKQELQVQTTKAAMMSTYAIIWRNKYMSLRSKIRIYTGARLVMTR